MRRDKRERQRLRRIAALDQIDAQRRDRQNWLKRAHARAKLAFEQARGCRWGRGGRA